MKFLSKVEIKTGLTGNKLIMDAPHIEELSDIKADKLYSIDIKRYVQRRSLNANAYAWMLCQTIAEKLSSDGSYITKEDVYRKAIIECGHFQAVHVANDYVDNFIKIWSSHGLGWIAVDMGKSDAGYSCIYAYHGSSIYTVTEMNRLIRSLLEETSTLGIDTLPPGYIDGMIDEWGENHGE